MKVHISSKNMKLGNIPNVSLPPIKTCVSNPPCAALCYARKAYEGYAKHVAGLAWNENLTIYQANPREYFGQIVVWLRSKKVTPPYFRWHVGGDIPDEAYLAGMQAVAQLCPKTQFLTYSRRPWAWGRWTENFVVLRSYWLDEEVGQEAGFKVVPKGQEIPKGLECSGSCKDCKACWYLAEGQYRVIHLH